MFCRLQYVYRLCPCKSWSPSLSYISNACYSYLFKRWQSQHTCTILLYLLCYSDERTACISIYTSDACAFS